jgi:type I restriction enzyme S subunit
MKKSAKDNTLKKLRFKQSNGTPYPEWKEAPLKTLANLITTKNKTTEVNRVLTNSAAIGIVDQRDYFEKDIANSGNLEGYYIVEEGDYVYNPRISNIAPVGPVSKNKIGRGLMSPLYTVFRFLSTNNDFYEQYFKTSHWFKYLRSVSNTGARFDRMSITPSIFMDMPVPYPDPEEQQKIAFCLSSLDDLITAHTQKLDVLKAHKKGLMQQLFPAEGEKLPKLRFEEFKESGEWEEKMIGEISKVTTGNKDTQNKVDNGVYPFFVRSQIVERINSFSYDGEAILTSGDGVGVGKNFHYIDGKFDFHQRVYCLYDFAEHVFGKYLYLYFSEHFYHRVMKMTAKNSVDSVRMAMITEMPILIPSIKEQQKIATCLFSLDELITRQAEKIEQLKMHKKGLMQGLFPNINEEKS